MTISFQKYDLTCREIKTGKARTSKKNEIQSNMLQFTTDLQMRARKRNTKSRTCFSYFSELIQFPYFSVNAQMAIKLDPCQ